MKILYDYQIFNSQAYGGISRYFYELMNQFKSSGEPDFELALRYSNNIYLNNTSIGYFKTFFKNNDFRGRRKLMSILNLLHSKKSLVSQQYDIFHPTYYNTYFLKFLDSKPFVLTIHDMAHEMYPWYFPSKDPTSKNKKLLTENAAKIIAVSETTKRDIIKIFQIDETKIHVIYHGNSLLLQPGDRNSRLNLPERYILYVGNRDCYKNYGFFIKAISSLLYQDEDLYLICVGGSNFTDSENNLLNKLHLRNKIQRITVDDEDLAYLYKKAIAFVFPSLFEGFGIPILEAFSCGCPVILSNIDVFLEVGGEAAVYFDPNDEVSIRESVAKVIYSKDIRCELINMGLQRVKRFSWMETACQTLDVYKSII